jgi:solute carrier family 6 amino acid/orphan transporter-like 15/16/17/18/20
MFTFQGKSEKEPYPDWVMVIAGLMITAGVLPMPIVFMLRRCQCLKLDLDIHQGAIRRIDTTVSTKEMMGDVDVRYHSASCLDVHSTVVILFTH